MFPLTLLWIMVMLAASAGGAWQLWRYRQAHQFLVRRATTAPPRIERVKIHGIAREIFTDVALLRVAQDFRRRREVPAEELDVEAMVERMVREGGWPVPVFGTRLATPEYLVLIDRSDYRDHQARFVDEMVGRLQENEVFLERFYFDQDPRLCFPGHAEDPPLSLRQLTAKHPEHRLLIFVDCLKFFNPWTGELEPWTDELADWPDAAILTPDRPEHWGARETVLARKFFVFPATVAGLTALVRQIGRGSAPPQLSRQTSAPFPEALRLAERWIDRDAPGLRQIEGVIAALRRYLGESGFFWLSACAVYPAVHWNLTLHLGNVLTGRDGRRLLDASRLAALVRLPWLRFGTMPDWLRARLIEGMSTQQEKSVRQALRDLLTVATLEVSVDGAHLEIARQHRKSIASLAAPLLRLLAKREPAYSPLRDYTFQSFIAGRRRRLAVELPRMLRERLESLGTAMQARRKEARKSAEQLRLVWRQVLSAISMEPEDSSATASALKRTFARHQPAFHNLSLLVVMVGTLIVLQVAAVTLLVLLIPGLLTGASDGGAGSEPAAQAIVLGAGPPESIPTLGGDTALRSPAASMRRRDRRRRSARIVSGP